MTPSIRDAVMVAYRAGLAAVDPQARVADALRRVQPAEPFRVLAVGKAAPAMARGALSVVAAINVLVIADHEEDVPPPARLMLGAHPFPDRSSLEAGRAALDFVAAGSVSETLLVLVSGGTSALMEVLPERVSLEDLADVQQAAMNSGMPIEQLNTLRRHLSRVKDGQLLAASPAATAITLLLSDVVDGPGSAVGSGPTLADGSRARDALQIARRYQLDLPLSLVAVLSGPDDRASDARPHHVEVVGDCEQAAEAAVRALDEQGLTADISTTALRGDATEIALAMVQSARPGLVSVAAGETTVTVTGSGLGGRNQSAALAAAIELDGVEGNLFAALSTDGRDGPTDAAGAIVDGSTAAAIRSAGLDPLALLANDDAHPALDAAGALIRTGPTGTNVGDLWFSWKPR